MGNKKQIQKTNDTAKKSKPQSRKSRMLSNPDVKRWHDNLARGSPLTAQTSLRRLDRFCQIHSMTPMELADLGLKDLRTLTDVIEDHVTWMEDENYSPGYIGGTIKAIKSWLRHFDVEIRRKIKIRNQDYTPTLQNERVPNEHEISEIFHRAGLRESVMISLMAKSGLRPEVLGNHNGTDGLQMRDLPDIVIHQGVIKCINSPCQIVVRRELSKTRHQYFTFLTASATKTVIAYLNDRLATGEPLHGNSPIVSPDYKYKTHRGANNSKIFLPTSRISKKIRDTFRPRFHWRPYVLRAYFDTQLLIAESKGKITHDFRVFFMGHKGTIESRYTTNKGILPEILVNEMRESFARSEELLDLERHKEDPTLQQKQQVQDVVQKATPHELGLMLEMIHTMNIGKTAQAR